MITMTAGEDYQRALDNWKEQYAESMRLKKALYDVTTLISQKSTVDGLSLDSCNKIVEFINAQQKGAEHNAQDLGVLDRELARSQKKVEELERELENLIDVMSDADNADDLNEEVIRLKSERS